MKFALVSDNHDTIIGMRLAGIEGVIVNNPEDVTKTLSAFRDDKNVAVILITEKLSKMCPELIKNFKLYTSRPLLIEIPDRHSDGKNKDSVLKYVREAIGVDI